jgi:hypothetical protein
MSVPTSKPPAQPRRKLVLRRIPNRPALPVVRPPPRPSHASLDPVRSQAGSLPPVAGTWPPPGAALPAAAPATAWDRRMRIAGGAALCGAVIAAAASLVVGPRSVSKPVAAVTVSAASAHAASHARPPTGPKSTVNTTPWIEVPLEPVLALPSAVPAAALPVARALPWPKTPSRAAPASTPVDPSDHNSSAPSESASALVPGRAAPAASSPKNAAHAPIDPVLKAVEDEIRGQPSLPPKR